MEHDADWSALPNDEKLARFNADAPRYVHFDLSCEAPRSTPDSECTASEDAQDLADLRAALDDPDNAVPIPFEQVKAELLAGEGGEQPPANAG